MDYSARPLTVLVDMDSVLCDWEQGFVDVFRREYPELPCAGVGERFTFDLFAGLGNDEIAATHAIMDRPGFYRDLAPIPGGADALNTMLDLGIDAVVCTSPWPSNATCASDKLTWLDTHIGHGWSSRAIITKDKTRVRGDILIDDRPNVSGAENPTWEQVYFTQSYNRDCAGRRIDSWAEWADVILGTPLARIPFGFSPSRGREKARLAVGL